MIELNRDPAVKDLRIFGLIGFPLFCMLVGAAGWFRHGAHGFAYVVWGAGAVTAFVSLVRIRWVRPVFLGVNMALFPVGWVISHALLMVIWILVFTPIGLLMRLLGRDPMNRKWDEQAESYWSEREEEPKMERYFKQF